ncbi:polysaccharide pyruvyl transferase family protein [Salegentibacter sp. F188]|uniref:Polysaccharide pyruvyl transferase family protein n=1 Tax=Autumnicola patrickiae TaxID=3075591 RepID=A0ABU3E294_9FLAO|nr:polysaccharide pyruvyl transferase family protein [Salegentibacter sp. F188]MDT0689804.1 polysaccharide pyruvyl transferase family protein [Salegentibacter sp. F188]
MRKRIVSKIKKFIGASKFRWLGLRGKKPIRVYYWKKKVNFGDLITPSLLIKFGYVPVFSKPDKEAQLISTGSLIEHIKPNFKGYILGTGAINEKTENFFPNAKILGLRGEFTKENLDVQKEIVLGDPGLISSILLKERCKKEFRLGIVPHFSDLENPSVSNLEKNNPSEITIIDVRNEPVHVLSHMDKCEYILSSSLHGLICADSLGIPNKWIKLSQLLGNDFKFKDYYSVFGVEPQPLIINGSESPDELISHTVLQDPKKLEKLKGDLISAFENLHQTING